MKAVAEALSRAQDVIESICEVIDDEGKFMETEIWIKIPAVRDSTYEKISEMCGIEIRLSSNNHMEQKQIMFRTDSENYRHRLCLEIAFEFLCKLIPWCEMVLVKG